MKVEVSDIFDAYHEIIYTCWRHGQFRGNPSTTTTFVGTRFDELVDLLEVDFFLSACSRRLLEAGGPRIEPGALLASLWVTNSQGQRLAAEAGAYHSSGFDWGKPQDDEVQCEVVSGDLISRPRTEVRLFIVTEETHN